MTYAMSEHAEFSSALARRRFNQEAFARQPLFPFANLSYQELIKTAENILFDDQADKQQLNQIFETLIEHFSTHPDFGYDATRLLEDTWTESSDLALDIMSNLSLLKEERVLNSFYATLSEKIADRLENLGHLDVIPSLGLLKDLAERRGHKMWYTHFSKAYIGTFNQMMGQPDLLDQSIGMLPEVLRAKEDLRDQYDDSSMGFICDFLEEAALRSPALVFHALFDIFESKVKLDSQYKNRLKELALKLMEDIPDFFENPIQGIQIACQFFSNFLSGSRDWHKKGLAAIDHGLKSLTALQSAGLTQTFIRNNCNNPHFCEALKSHLKTKVERPQRAPAP